MHSLHNIPSCSHDKEKRQNCLFCPRFPTLPPIWKTFKHLQDYSDCKVYYSIGLSYGDSRDSCESFIGIFYRTVWQYFFMEPWQSVLRLILDTLSIILYAILAAVLCNWGDDNDIPASSIGCISNYLGFMSLGHDMDLAYLKLWEQLPLHNVETLNNQLFFS